jgi:hypothetical protein
VPRSTCKKAVVEAQVLAPQLNILSCGPGKPESGSGVAPFECAERLLHRLQPWSGRDVLFNTGRQWRHSLADLHGLVGRVFRRTDELHGIP